MTTTIDRTALIRQDLFDAIKYDNGANLKKNCTIGKQLGPHFVFAWIFKEAWTKLSIGITTVDKYKFHSTQDLFNDDETWAGHDKATRIAIGRCLAYFVAHKMLPLECVTLRPGNKLYGVILD